MNVLPDAPVLIVVLHLAALAALLSYGVVTQVRRLLILRATRPKEPPKKTFSRPVQLSKLRH